MPAPNSTLAAIRTKVRRLTKSPSDGQITDAQIDEYVNTFIVYDFPEHLRLFALHSTFTFYLNPNIDQYTTNTTDPNNPLFNFRNKYITISDPIYVAGYKILYTQSREQFFNIYPQVANIVQQAVGDGATLGFNGTLSAIPVVRNNVLFSSIDGNGNGLTLNDDGAGNLTGSGNGTINYLTGAFTLNFNVAPGAQENINSQTQPYVPAIPQSVLYYDDVFTFRPIPDQPYQVTMDVYVRPTFLAASGDSPYLEQWWQWIAYGAAKKILEDRLDYETVGIIMPEYKKQEMLVNRTTIVQNTVERSATIYTESTMLNPGPYGWFNGNQ